MLLGSAAYLIELWNTERLLNEKGYYFTLLLFGLFASVSLQKSVRDRADGIPVTGLYYAIYWCSLIVALVLLTIGLINATLLLSEKGFDAMAYALSLFGAVAVRTIPARRWRSPTHRAVRVACRQYSTDPLQIVGCNNATLTVALSSQRLCVSSPVTKSAAFSQARLTACRALLQLSDEVPRLSSQSRCNSASTWS